MDRVSKHMKRDKIKWIITFVLIAVLTAGMVGVLVPVIKAKMGEEEFRPYELELTVLEPSGDIGFDERERTNAEKKGQRAYTEFCSDCHDGDFYWVHCDMEYEQGTENEGKPSRYLTVIDNQLPSKGGKVYVNKPFEGAIILCFSCSKYENPTYVRATIKYLDENTDDNEGNTDEQGDANTDNNTSGDTDGDTGSDTGTIPMAYALSFDVVNDFDKLFSEFQRVEEDGDVGYVLICDAPEMLTGELTVSLDDELENVGEHISAEVVDGTMVVVQLIEGFEGTVTIVVSIDDSPSYEVRAYCVPENA